ncbi:MAG: glycosyltransferase family 4 protein, partial [Lentisphaerae bacterium]|nr:glycosyltransferase family 4 protein [Lentisphaerota bacterium]
PELCSRLNRLHMRALLPSSVRGAALCIVSTHHVADRLREVLGVPAARLAVVPLGVDAARFGAPAPRPRLPGLPEERPYLLFVGNLEPKKGIDTLLDAYAIAACASRFDLVVAGRAAWRCAGVRRRLLHWPSPGRVHWLGRVTGAALPGLMQHAAVLVQPSLEEGFGMPVLEAMAAGTPVLHSDHPALMEAAGGAGLAFRLGGAADLAGRLDALLGDAPWQAELAAAGRERAAALPWRRWGAAAAGLLKAAAGMAAPR